MDGSVPKLRSAFAALIAAVVCGSTLFACGGDDATSSDDTVENAAEATATPASSPVPDGTGKTIGLVIPDISNEQVRMYKEGAEQVAKEAGAELLTTSTYDAAKQLSAVETYIARGVDGLALGVNDPKAVVPAVKEANAKNIPVTALTTKPPGGDLVSFAGYDLPAMGEQVGTWMAEKLGPGAKVGIVEGLPSDGASGMLDDGFTKTAEAGGLEVVESQPADWDRAKALKVATDMLTANPDIKGIFATNDDQGLGVLQAASSLGRSDLVIAGIQGQCDGLASILAGKMSYTVMFFNELVGANGVTQILKELAGEPTEAEVIMPLIGVDQESAQEILDGGGGGEEGMDATKARLEAAQNGCN